MIGKALQVQQEPQRQEKKAAESKDKLIQQKISEIKAQSSSISGQSKIAVKLPAPPSNSAAQELATKDAQTRVNQLKSRLPHIRSEYQALIEQQVLDEKTVQQALQATERALNNNDLLSAQAHLQALDDARIQVMQQMRSQWIAQLEYLQERLDAITQRIPQRLFEKF